MTLSTSRASTSADVLRTVRSALDRAVRRACPPSMQADADDIVQQAWVRITSRYEACDELEQISPSYLWRVAHNAMIDAMRTATRRSERERIHGERLAAEPRDPEAEAHAREIAKGLHDCLQGLNRDRRAVLALHLEGHSTSQIEARLGWEHKRVRNLVFRGMRQLRSCLENKGLRP